jgi:hypothetical protein
VPNRVLVSRRCPETFEARDSSVAIVVFDWKIVKLFWVRSQRYSERFQTVLAVVVFLMQIFWIGAAGESGFALATFVVRHVG